MAIKSSNNFVEFDAEPSGDPGNGPTFGRLTGTSELYLWNGATWDMYDIGASGGASYLVYTAILNQTSTNAPVATVLENTLGGTLVWEYDGLGIYKATLAGAFVANSFCVLIHANQPEIFIQWERGSDDVLYLYAVHQTNNVNDAMINTTIEIRVYP